MPRQRAIREKLLLGALLVGVMVAVLSASSFLGIYSSRRLVRSLSCRVAELPLASELGECVGILRVAHARALADETEDDVFDSVLRAAAAALEAYRQQLAAFELDDVPLALPESTGLRRGRPPPRPPAVGCCSPPPRTSTRSPR